MRTDLAIALIVAKKEVSRVETSSQASRAARGVATLRNAFAIGGQDT
jgi:hypothetical protein